MSTVIAAVAPAASMTNFPLIGTTLATSSVLLDPRLPNVSTHAAIALGIAVTVVAGVFCVSRLWKSRRRPALRS